MVTQWLTKLKVHITIMYRPLIPIAYKDSNGSEKIIHTVLMLGTSLFPCWIAFFDKLKSSEIFPSEICDMLAQNLGLTMIGENSLWHIYRPHQLDH